MNKDTTSTVNKIENIFPILLTLAEIKNINVVWKQLNDGYNGLWKLNNGVQTIILGEHLRDNLQKKIFILAHELGHGILHKNSLDNSCYWSNNRNNEYAKQKEAEANAFARALVLGITLGMSSHE